jgi:hypothetical protein
VKGIVVRAYHAVAVQDAKEGKVEGGPVVPAENEEAQEEEAAHKEAASQEEVVGGVLVFFPDQFVLIA